jgi:hypothetical protein
MADGLLLRGGAVKTKATSVDGHSSVDDATGDVLVLSRILWRRPQEPHSHGDTATLCTSPCRSQVSISPFPFFDKDVKITVVIEDAGVQKFELEALATALSVLVQKPFAGVPGLRVLVQILQVGMRRRAVKVEVILLHILPVIAFARRHAEGPLAQFVASLGMFVGGGLLVGCGASLCYK